MDYEDIDDNNLLTSYHIAPNIRENILWILLTPVTSQKY